jgi:hypothetical protein
MSHLRPLDAPICMQNFGAAFLLGFGVAVGSCGGSAVLLESVDGGDAATARDSGRDAGPATGHDAAVGDAPCGTPPWQFGNTGDAQPSWVSGSCPDGGCPHGTVCVFASIADDPEVPLGCAPIAATCGGDPTCSCMGCVCGGPPPPLGGCSAITNPSPPNVEPAPIVCGTGTVSRREFKEDIAYVDDEQRDVLAREALAIPLAHYRYKNEPPDARRRLGFIIDDQPDPSPAVDGDRTHVDQYGYTSMLLATVQQQAKELAELRRRIDALERQKGIAAAPPGLLP